MKSYRSYVSVLLCLLGLVTAGVSHAGESVEVISAEGSVTVVDAAGQPGRAVRAQSILAPGSILSTGPTARAVVRVGTDGVIVVGRNSQVEINRTKDHAGFFRHITGMIYYALNTIKSNQRPVEVRTASATLGIRGTRFLVFDLPDRKEIGMRKGLISVASPEGEFEIHRQKEQDEFEAFKHEGEVAVAKEKREFEEYKANAQREFVEYKREFALGANRMASFDGKRVTDRPLSGETKSDIELSEAYAAEWLQEIHD